MHVTPAGRCAPRLAPLVFVHPGEPRKAEWAGGAEWWRYTVTKTDTPHMVPSDPPGGRDPSQATSSDRTRPLRLPERTLSAPGPTNELRYTVARVPGVG